MAGSQVVYIGAGWDTRPIQAFSKNIKSFIYIDACPAFECKNYYRCSFLSRIFDEMCKIDLYLSEECNTIDFTVEIHEPTILIFQRAADNVTVKYHINT